MTINTRNLVCTSIFPHYQDIELPTPLHDLLNTSVTKMSVKKIGKQKYLVTTIMNGIELADYECTLAERKQHKETRKSNHYIQAQNNIYVEVYETQFNNIELIDHPGTRWSGIGACSAREYVTLSNSY